jgi:hypothetical protein
LVNATRPEHRIRGIRENRAAVKWGIIRRRDRARHHGMARRCWPVVPPWASLLLAVPIAHRPGAHTKPASAVPPHHRDQSPARRVQVAGVKLRSLALLLLTKRAHPNAMLTAAEHGIRSGRRVRGMIAHGYTPVIVTASAPHEIAELDVVKPNPGGPAAHATIRVAGWPLDPSDHSGAAPSNSSWFSSLQPI